MTESVEKQGRLELMLSLEIGKIYKTVLWQEEDLFEITGEDAAHYYFNYLAGRSSRGIPDSGSFGKALPFIYEEIPVENLPLYLYLPVKTSHYTRFLSSI